MGYIHGLLVDDKVGGRDEYFVILVGDTAGIVGEFHKVVVFLDGE
jgi:hypothetical protein